MKVNRKSASFEYKNIFSSVFTETNIYYTTDKLKIFFKVKTEQPTKFIHFIKLSNKNLDFSLLKFAHQFLVKPLINYNKYLCGLKTLGK